MSPFRKGFCHLDSESVEEKVVAVGIFLEQSLTELTGFFPHGDRLHGQHIGRASVGQIVVEIGDAITIAAPLPG